MFKHLLIKHSLAKTVLIVALHASVTFDAWTTVRVQNQPFPAHFHAVEDDPLMRPFAKGPALYPAINLLPLPVDLLLLKAKSRRARIIGYAIALTAVALEVRTSVNNMQLYNQTSAQYRQQFICSGCRADTK